MELPKPNEVRSDFSKIVENLDSFITFISTQESVRFEDFHDGLHSIIIEIIEIWHRIDLLTITSKKYSKAFERVRKILLKLSIEWRDVEEKHLKDNFLPWGFTFRRGKLRKDSIKFFQGISKQMKKVHKILGPSGVISAYHFFEEQTRKRPFLFALLFFLGDIALTIILFILDRLTRRTPKPKYVSRIF